VHRVGGDRPLVQRQLQAGAQLALVELLAATVLLDDGRQLQLRRLESVEAFATCRAFAPPTHRRAVLAQPRVDDAGVLVLAEGAVHQAPAARGWGLEPGGWGAK